MILARVIINGVTEELIDYILVENTAHEMHKKLKKKRQKGSKGWHHPTRCDNVVLLKMLHSHINKGDMIDVVNLAAMIQARHDMFGETTILDDEKGI